MVRVCLKRIFEYRYRLPLYPIVLSVPGTALFEIYPVKVLATWEKMC
jgi:hypothetical protein